MPLAARTDTPGIPKAGVLYPIACAALAAAAFAFNWGAGHRGVFLFDQSQIVDGGWRILQGQAPYKDFLFPYGPVTFYIQALFFWISGVNWSATVLPACVMNALATLSVIRLVRLLGGGSRLLALAGGLATAICFQAPFGTLWLEQTAMFFDLLALQSAVESFHASGYRRNTWQLAAGVLLALAALSKQSFGVFFFPVVFAVVVAAYLDDLRAAFRAVLLVAAGIAAAGAIFLAWVVLFSDFHAFVERAVVIAGEIGRPRMNLRSVVTALTFRYAPRVGQVDLVGVFFGAIGLCLAAYSFLAKGAGWSVWRKAAPASAAALLLPIFRSLTQVTTLNDWENDCAFLGLATCLGVAIMLDLVRDPHIHPRLPFARVLAVCFLLAVGYWGAKALRFVSYSAWTRQVQEFREGTQFRDPVQVKGMERVLWGEPTLLRKTVLPKADFEGVASYLSTKDGAFFVMGDSTMLYGLLGRRSPQPLLYFQIAHSFMEREIPTLDESVTASLVRNDVRIVVREKFTFMARTDDLYARFPRLRAWFTENFAHAADFGNYEVWERKPGGR